MTKEALYSPFDMQLQCFSYLGEINSLINSLGESEISTLCELESIAHSMHSMLLRIDCYISMQTHNLKIQNHVPKLRKEGETC